MTIIEEIYKEAHPADGKPPREILIAPEKIDGFVSELNALRMHPFKDVEKITPESFRIYGAWMYGIPVRPAPPQS